MFYTGLNSSDDETIGFATASEIDTLDAPGHWARLPAPCFTALDAPSWVKQTHVWSFRDPFVMVDPENPFTRYLMFFCAKTASDTNHLAVGVARSGAGNPASWSDVGVYPVTEFGHNAVNRLESPHVFPDSINHDFSQHLQAAWRLMYTDGDWHDSSRVVFFNTKIAGSPITDRAFSSWTATPTSLFDFLHLTPGSPEFGYQASEILQIGGTYYWAGYDGNNLRFRKLFWGGSNEFLLTIPDLVAVGDSRPHGTVRMSLAELLPGRGSARFRIELPARMRARVVVYDIMGRAIRSLADRDLDPGATEIAWDGRGESGANAGSGVYFARLVANGGSHVVRVPLVR